MLASRIQIALIDEELAMEAGALRCRHRRLSLADCLILALARTRKAILLTTDRALAEVSEVSVKLFEV